MRIERGPYGSLGILPLTEADKVIEYQLKLLENQTIPFFTPVFLRSFRNNIELCFDLTGLLPLRELPSQQWLPREKRSALLHLLTAIIESENYYLSPANILMDEGYIFVCPEKKQLLWCYTPLENSASKRISYERLEQLLFLPCLYNLLQEGERSQIISLFKDEREGELTSYLHEMQQNLPRENIPKRVFPCILFFLLTLLGIYTIGIILENTYSHIPRELNEYVLLFISGISILLYRIKSKKENESESAKEKKELPKEILFPTHNKTENYNWPPMFLIRVKEQSDLKRMEKAVILTDEFLLGADVLLCDYAINHPTISGLHAKIQRNSASFFLTDLGSDHGTWVQNHRLSAHQKHTIQEGDIIRLGEMTFLFTNGKG